MAQQHGENLKQAMDTLRAHKLRSFLTVFGVVLGVSVIMLVAALITGFDQQVQESIKQYGADTAFISRFDQGPQGGGRRPKEERERKPLTLEDGQAIRELCPAVRTSLFLSSGGSSRIRCAPRMAKLPPLISAVCSRILAPYMPTPRRSTADSSAKATICTAKKW